MNGASKILTVSYGTFSCTLEGFDDPFNTMKAIAEYFRDLAAEDRYFGAEPPTPDAAMLHRIAEREIQRRVEAKIQENGVVLRASDAEAPAVMPAAVAAVAPSVAPSVAPAPVAVAPAVVADAPAPAVSPAEAPVAESVVEKLSRLRSEVAAQPGTVAPVATMPTVSFAIPDYLEDEHAEVIEAVPATPAAAAFAPDIEPEAEIVPNTAPDFEDALPEAEAPVELAPATLAEDAPLPEDVAPASDDAVLAALTSDLAQPLDAVGADDAEPTEAATADAAEPALPESLIAALADSLAGTEAEETVAEVAFEAEAPDVADTLPEAIAVEVTEAEVVEAEVAEVAEASEPDAASLDDLVADIASAPFDAAETVIEAQAGPAMDAVEPSVDAQEEALEAAFERTQEDTLEAAFERSVDEVAALDGAVEDATPATGLELRPGAAEKLQRARARVIRIRKVEDAAPEAVVEPTAEAAEPAPVATEAPAPVAPVRPVRVQRDAPAAEPVAQEQPDEDTFEASLSDIFAEVADDDAKTPAPAAPVAAEAPQEVEPVEGLLSAEDEAELMRELAALRQNEEEGPDADAAAGASAFVLQQENRKGFPASPADEALGRLMRQTDTEMEGPETKRRQSAIAHLKAAVAATVADRKVTGDKPADTSGISRLARYRNDLAMVVKSALPGRSTDEAPKERPAPLVLVSEQRIDKPRPAAPSSAPSVTPTVVATGPAPVAPVRPRRIVTSGAAMQAAEDTLYDDEDADEDVSNLFGDAKGFGDFVERVGATTLEEILEASAAYLAGVERLESFSRPQVMSQVGAVVPPGSFLREDGLRGFGTLLRNGRISKLRRGQFVLSEESPYLAEARKIAG